MFVVVREDSRLLDVEGQARAVGGAVGLRSGSIVGTQVAGRHADRDPPPQDRTNSEQQHHCRLERCHVGDHEVSSGQRVDRDCPVLHRLDGLDHPELDRNRVELGEPRVLGAESGQHTGDLLDEVRPRVLRGEHKAPGATRWRSQERIGEDDRVELKVIEQPRCG